MFTPQMPRYLRYSRRPGPSSRRLRWEIPSGSIKRAILDQPEHIRRGLPGCGRGVIVPTSTNPKPKPRDRVDVTLRGFVEARRKTDGIGKSRPISFRGPAMGWRDAAAPEGPESTERAVGQRVGAIGELRRKRKGRISRYVICGEDTRSRDAGNPVVLGSWQRSRSSASGKMGLFMAGRLVAAGPSCGCSTGRHPARICSEKRGAVVWLHPREACEGAVAALSMTADDGSSRSM